MPRVARKYIKSNFIHIVTKGIKKEFIFYKEKYKNEYISLLNKYLNEIKELKMLSYCIMDNHAHILTYTTEINKLSEFMKKLNTAYAIYYNEKEEREGYVFANRYYTQTIKDEIHLLACIKYIHENPVKAGLVNNAKEYKYSSYKKMKNGEIDLEVINSIFESTIDYLNFEDIDLSSDEYEFIEAENHENKLNSSSVEEIIERFCQENQTSLNEVKKSNYLILKFKEYLNRKYRVSNKNICAILGIGKNRISLIEKRNK